MYKAHSPHTHTTSLSLSSFIYKSYPLSLSNMFSSIGESLDHRLGVDERKKKRRFIIWSCCMITITLIVLRATAISTPNPNTKHHFHTVSKGLNFFKTINSNLRSPHSTSSSSNEAIITSCKSTLYPAACEAALAGASTKSAKKLFDISIESAKIRATSAREMAYNLTFARGKSRGRRAEHGTPTAFDDCLELLDISMEQLDDVIKICKKEHRREEDIQTWLSAALTNQVTCSDGLDAAGVELHAKQAMAAQINVLSQYISNALALHASLKGGSKGGGGGRRLLSDGFPEWVTAGDRKLLEASPGDIRADAVVAKDGSGTHRTIGEAIAFVSLKSGGGGRSVIYVKAGTYREYIKVPTKQKNVMLMGDGKGKSVIIGSHNAKDGWNTYESATVAGMGAGFIAKGLTIINDSGPNKEQAVALRVGADKSVIYQCSIQGYQDTLYTLSNRQFYRDCDISGTVDFIFGNSAAVIQNCFIQPRGGNTNYITAQGRTDPNQNTGISVQGSRISGSSGGKTYLGRPWKQYSRVVFIETEIDGSVNSAGWARWSGNFALSTLYYGEFRNTGAGAGTSGRVKWPGVHSALSVAEASKFTVANLIDGNSWIPGTGVQYNGGL